MPILCLFKKKKSKTRGQKASAAGVGLGLSPATHSCALYVGTLRRSGVCTNHLSSRAKSLGAPCSLDMLMPWWHLLRFAGKPGGWWVVMSVLAASTRIRDGGGLASGLLRGARLWLLSPWESGLWKRHSRPTGQLPTAPVREEGRDSGAAGGHAGRPGI